MSSLSLVKSAIDAIRPNETARVIAASERSSALGAFGIATWGRVREIEALESVADLAGRSSEALSKFWQAKEAMPRLFEQTVIDQCDAVELALRELLNARVEMIEARPSSMSKAAYNAFKVPYDAYLAALNAVDGRLRDLNSLVAPEVAVVRLGRGPVWKLRYWWRRASFLLSR